MYKWDIEITLKGSGFIKHFVHTGRERNSIDVIKKLFHSKAANDYVELYGEDMKTVCYICIGDIAIVEISDRKECQL